MTQVAGEALHSLEKKLGYRFKRPELLEEALTHSSYANESGPLPFNERLEYLGDAVLELCASLILYNDRPTFSEGHLTKTRAAIVSEAPLATWAHTLDIPGHLRISKGLERQGGRKNPSVLADAMEAVLGAVFIDGGLDEALTLVRSYVGTLEINTAHEEERDYKSQLQEIVQATWLHPPIYRLLGRSGPDHAAQFEIEVSLPDGTPLAMGHGSSIKGAGFDAARAAIEKLRKKREDI